MLVDSDHYTLKNYNKAFNNSRNIIIYDALNMKKFRQKDVDEYNKRSVKSVGRRNVNIRVLVDEEGSDKY